jgi:hypothetical protein
LEYPLLLSTFASSSLISSMFRVALHRCNFLFNFSFHFMISAPFCVLHSDHTQTLITDTIMPWLAPVRWVIITALAPKLLLS